MYCSKCGNQFDDQATVCPSCGTQVGAAAPQAPAAAGVVTSDEKTMGMLAHLLGLFTWILGPLIIWLIKKEESQFIAEQAKEALNFQISLTIYWIISGILTLVVIGALTSIALVIFEIVVIIQACMAANKGEYYRYPLCIRFIQ